MNDNEQYKIFEMLMLMGLADGKAVFNICSMAIISLSIINRHTEKEFDELLGFMKKSFSNADDLDDIINKLGIEDLGL